MITRVTVKNFKRYKAETQFDFKPSGLTFLAGGNNSGKSTLLQALAVWEFCRSLIEIERGANAFLTSFHGHPVGLTAEEFTPIALPDLEHLWHNLETRRTTSEGGYSLKITCEWQDEDSAKPTHRLGFTLSLAQDRLYVKPCDSNLVTMEKVPHLSYLPPFAGIQPKEERMSPARQKRLIGQGLAGGVLRNILYELWDQNRQEMTKLKGSTGRISGKERAQFLGSDPWSRLSEVLEQVFKVGLTVENFNDLYHTTIKVALFEGHLVNTKFTKKPDISARDIMVEGSGFLQWLSVYALAVNPVIDVLLLDEPDAHLHPSLQNHLVFRLNQFATQNRKQALIATHSTTVLSEVQCRSIFRMEARNYLVTELDLVPLFAGIGGYYSPKLDQLKRHKRLLFHEGPSDIELLQQWAKTLRIPWPTNLVLWKYTKDRDARETLFSELRSEISPLQCLSIQDRDDNALADVKSDLTFANLKPFNKGLGLRMWKRRNIENYLLVPEAIARAAQKPLDEVKIFLRDHHAISVTTDFLQHDCNQTLALTDGKKIISTGINPITSHFGITYEQIAEAMEPGEIADDIKTLLDQIIDLCK